MRCVSNSFKNVPVETEFVVGLTILRSSDIKIYFTALDIRLREIMIFHKYGKLRVISHYNSVTGCCLPAL